MKSQKSLENVKHRFEYKNGPLLTNLSKILDK